MPSTFYKGDVSEVTMGHECGIDIAHDTPCKWTATWSPDYPDYTTITFTDVANGLGLFGNSAALTTGQLQVPLGMLIGSRMSFHSESGGNFFGFSYKADNSRVYTIVDHTFDSSNNATQLKIVPAIGNAGGGASTTNSAAGDRLFIHTTGLPAIKHFPSTGFAGNNAVTSYEWSAIDQFIGLASFMSLPDTTVELHQHHVVGLGRQATILQPGRLSHMGGSLEMPLHSPRWLYYSLGREVVNPYLMTVNHAYNGNSAYIKVAQGLGLIEAIAP